MENKNMLNKLNLSDTFKIIQTLKPLKTVQNEIYMSTVYLHCKSNYR